MKECICIAVLFFATLWSFGQNNVDKDKKKYKEAEFLTRITILRNPFITDSVCYDPNFGFTDYFLEAKSKQIKSFKSYYKHGVYFTSDSSFNYEDSKALYQLLRDQLGSTHTNFCESCQEMYKRFNLSDLRNGEYGSFFNNKHWIEPATIHQFKLSKYWLSLPYLYGWHSVSRFFDTNDVYCIQTNMKIFYIPMGKMWLTIPNYNAKNKNQLFIKRKVQTYFITDIVNFNYIPDDEK